MDGHLPRSTRRRLLLVAALALVALVAGALNVQLDAMERLDATRASAERRSAELAGSRAENAARGADLEALLAELADARVDRASAEADQKAAEAARAAAESDRRSAAGELASASSEHSEAAAELERIRSDADAILANVAHAAERIDADSELVPVLSLCLAGVSQLLNQLSVGDESGAVATAGAIRDACAIVDVAVSP